MNCQRTARAQTMIALLCLGLAPFAPLSRFAGAAELPKKTVTIEGITEYQMDNGLRVLLFPDESAPNVTVNLTVLVGSRHEGYGEAGMAHLLEHMLFKGTPTHPQIPKLLRERGAAFNGTTWVDRTNYFETMEGTDANLEFAIRLEADRLVNSYVKREDLLSEMTVVRSEFEAGENNPQTILSQRMLTAAYAWHNYGKSTIGNRSDIERVPIDRLQAFYRKHYQPDNCILIVAGKFDEAKALSYIAKYFGPLQRPARKLDATYTEEPPQDGERRVVLRRVGKIGVVGLVYHIPAGSHPDFAAVEVLSSVLASEPSGRLYKALVPTKKCTNVGGVAFNWHDPGVLEVIAQADRDSSLDAVRDALTDVVENVARDKISPTEVERAKRELLAERDLLMTKSNRIGVVLSEWASMGDWRLFFLHRDRLSQVTVDDVNRVAAQYLVRSNRTVGMYFPADKPERASVPPAPPIESLVKDYKGSKAITAGEVFEPTPANIERRVERYTLPSGLKVALLPKKTRGESVVAHLTLRYGNEEVMAGHTSATQLIATLMERGTKKHTRQQIQDELNKLSAQLESGGLLGDASFQLEAKRKTFPAALSLLKEILREPVFPKEEFEIFRRELRDGLERSSTEPAPLAMRDLQRRLNPYPKEDVRYVPTVQDSIERLGAVTRDEVVEIYKNQIGAQAGELAVVGDFDPIVVRGLVQDIFAGWKAPVTYHRIERTAQTNVKGARHTIYTPDKANAIYTAGEHLPMKDTDPDFAALEVADFLFGGGSLSSRLGDRVRQKEGLSYGVVSHFSADARDPLARFSISAICNPMNINKVDKAISEELDRLIKDGVGGQELEEAKKAYLTQQKVARANDGFVARMLAEELSNGRTLSYYATLEKQIEGLSPEAVSLAVRKHLDPKRLVIIHAGDFKRQAKAGK
jgi:zinc protease